MHSSQLDGIPRPDLVAELHRYQQSPNPIAITDRAGEEVGDLESLTDDQLRDLVKLARLRSLLR